MFSALPIDLSCALCSNDVGGIDLMVKIYQVSIMNTAGIQVATFSVHGLSRKDAQRQARNYVKGCKAVVKKS